MKRFLLLAALFCAGFNQASATQKSDFEAPDYIITEDHLILAVHPVEYMNAQYVKIYLLDNTGNVQASATTQPGQTVKFSITDASARVRSVFHLADGQEFIIIDDNPPN